MRLKRLTSLVVISGLCFLLSGCGHGILNPQGRISHDQLKLLIVSVALMLIVVIPVLVMSIWFVRRYRDTHKREDYAPNWGHSVLLEIIWWGVPLVIIIVLAIITWITTHRLDPYRPLTDKKPPLTIQVVSLDWKWLFIYPKQGIATVNYVQFPVHTPIRFMITSDAPMNSFIIPQLAGQIYAMAGMRTQLNLNAEKPGTYYGRSANYSGTGFNGMNFTAKASSDQAFKQWVRQVKAGHSQLDHKQYNHLFTPSKDSKVTYYSRVEPHLFEQIIAKYKPTKIHRVGHDQPEEVKL